ncbi:MAG: ABC transporter permease subunit, partial [Pirellulales bacterium]|nr:ABC transporter permease subunit [Pirellulales bacterium]
RRDASAASEMPHAGHYPQYALTISAGDGNQRPVLFDTTRPGPFPSWGSPHRDFGGPGSGSGGGRTAPVPNNRSLGSLLVPPGNPPPSAGRVQLHWEQPVSLRKLLFLAGDRPVDVTLHDLAGKEFSISSKGGSGQGSVHQVAPRASQITDAEIQFPQGGGIAEIRFAWPGRILADWEARYPWLSRLIYNPVIDAIAKPEIQYSLALSLISCTVTAIISLWIAVPLGYLLSRYSFVGKGFVDAILDIPIVLPPLVVGLSLLILFQFMPSEFASLVVYQVPAVIIAQVAVACAFAVRTMKAAFDQIDPRCEQVALTLGCSRAAAFSRVVLPEAVPGMLTAGTLAWARALGEFGPLLIFAGATRNKTEVLSTSVFLELSVGDLAAAVSISLIMILAAVIVLVLTRFWGTKTISL